MKRCINIREGGILFGLAVFAAAVAAANAAPDAETILKDTGVRGGVVVHLGCGDGQLTATLRADERYLVQGLARDPADVAKARAAIRAKGLYGPVSVDRLVGRSLPYGNDVVNLLVVEDAGVPAKEMLRVLAPGGVAYAKEGGKWSKTVKPWPDEIDQWTHYLHDATNNAVAADTQVGPPASLRWIAGPLWARSHEFITSLTAMISADGRLFYVFDEGLTGVTPESIPDRWTLIARDAFNGKLLWKRPIPDWKPAGQWKSRALRSLPFTVPRSIVAEGDRLFVTLGYSAPVTAIDAAGGETLWTYKGTDATQELRCLDGVLLVRTPEGVAAFETAIDKKLWEVSAKLQAFTLAAQNGRVFYQAKDALHCVDLKSGKPRWQAPAKTTFSLLLACGDRLVLAGGKNIQAVSTETGKALWTANASAGRGELFVAQGKVWHWAGGEKIVGRDLATGEVAVQLNTEDVFTRGHHLRCYQSKATENYLITPNRGIEFVSLTGKPNAQADWVRGPCRYGVMPANGLLYSGPDPCFCYIGVKQTGFNALAPARKRTLVPTARLEEGPAYGEIRPSTGSGPDGNRDDWPTYRHDARRTGAAARAVATDAAMQWQTKLKGPLTPPVAAGGRVYVAAKDEHTLYALDVADGKQLWSFTAGGRIDSPPTILGQTVLFGSADGRVYCLRAADGELAWRFRAAPVEERILAFGQLESPWRVHGSVLVTEGVAYCTAGRSTYLDGGIHVFGLDPATGKVLYEKSLDTWARTRKDAVGKPFIPGYHIEGALSDVLVAEGGSIYMGQYKFDRTLAEQDVPYLLPDPDRKVEGMDLSGQPFVIESTKSMQGHEDHQRNWVDKTQKGLVAQYNKEYGGYSFGHRKMGRHVLSTSGFLDDSWYNRTIWMYSGTWPGFYHGNLGAKSGHLLVVGPEKTYAVQAYPHRNLQSPLFTPGGKGYQLFADNNEDDPVLGDKTVGTTKGWGFTRSKPPVWYEWMPVRIRAMVLAGEVLFIAGPPDVVDPDDPMGAFEGRKGGLLRAVSAADGKTLTERKLDAPPVFDGLIAAAGRLILCTTDGRVLCLGKAK